MFTCAHIYLNANVLSLLKFDVKTVGSQVNPLQPDKTCANACMWDSFFPAKLKTLKRPMGNTVLHIIRSHDTPERRRVSARADTKVFLRLIRGQQCNKHL